jgi:hypothetical protein
MDSTVLMMKKKRKVRTIGKLGEGGSEIWRKEWQERGRIWRADKEEDQKNKWKEEKKYQKKMEGEEKNIIPK